MTNSPRTKSDDTSKEISRIRTRYDGEVRDVVEVRTRLDGTVRTVYDPDPAEYVLKYDAHELQLGPGDSVETWNDSANGYDVVQTDSTLQPTYDGSGLNGNPAVSFDSDEYLEGGYFDEPFEQPYTFALVARTDERWHSYAWYGADTDQRSFLNLGHMGSDDHAFWAGDGLLMDATTDPHVYICVADGEDSVVRRDGEEIVGDAGDLAHAGITIGAHSDGSRGFRGEMGELRLYDRRLTADERASLQGELESKWFETDPVTEIDTFADGTFASGWHDTANYAVSNDAEARNDYAAHRESTGQLVAHKDAFPARPSVGSGYMVWTMKITDPPQYYQMFHTGNDPDNMFGDAHVAFAYDDDPDRLVIRRNDGSSTEARAESEVDLPAGEYLTGVGYVDDDKDAHYWVYDSEDNLVDYISGYVGPEEE